MMARSVVLALLLVTAAARADAPPEAKAHYQAGEAYYDQERWAEAAHEFEEAYRISKLPDLLLNIARAQTHLGDEEAALKNLEAYLAAAPDATDAPSVKAEIAARRAALEHLKAARRAQQEADRARDEREAAQRHAAAEAAERERAEREARRLAVRPKWPGIGLIALGAVLGGVGIGLGVAANNNAATVSNGGVKDPDATGSIDWVSAHDGRYANAQSDGKRDAAAGIALDVIAVAAAATGVGVLVWAMRGPKAERRTWIAPSPNGVMVGGAF